MATEKVIAMEEEGPRKRKMKPSAVSSTEPTDMYLIIPSYAEAFKAEINDIQTLQQQAIHKNISNVHFRIAFANSRNIKKMVIKTKILIIIWVNTLMISILELGG